ncbi:MAG: hypothetical protein LBR97_02785 [Dysgonamonadaceae bacterium]|jgi:hypothetical protein|nr:hypothetical protein [Dysgonamonadaceae bacterium]
MECEDDGEWPTYAIKSIDLNTNEKVVLDEQISNECVKMSERAILYCKEGEIISWDLESKIKTVYYRTDKDMDLIGLCYNTNTSRLLIIQINFKTNELFLKILDDRKQIIFNHKIKVNDMEIEGVIPIFETWNNFFVLSIQYGLYTIDSEKLDFKQVSDKCDSYALSNRKVIYYEFIADGKTEGHSIDLITRESKKVDNLPNDKIFNCKRAFLFTANIDGNFIPTYIVCNKPYLLVNCKWQLISEIFIYKDNRLTVKMPFAKDVATDNSFQWELQ